MKLDRLVRKWRRLRILSMKELVVDQLEAQGVTNEDIDAAYHRLGIGNRTYQERMIERDLAESQEDADELLLEMVFAAVAVAFETKLARSMFAMPIAELIRRAYPTDT